MTGQQIVEIAAIWVLAGAPAIIVPIVLYLGKRKG